MDLDETMFREVRAEELADAGVYTENRLRCWRLQGYS